MVAPDVLIVDEILAVGDFLFRKKCTERMNQMLAGGTTLLYVSHNIDSVKELCTHALWLDQGRVRSAGEVNEVCDEYEKLEKK